MERIDFRRAADEGTAYIAGCMKDFVRDGVFTEDEMKAVDPEKIYGFFETDTGKRAVYAYEHGELYREQTFESKVPVNGEDVLVQGVIDCMFHEDGGIVLVDYKTNYIDRTRMDEEVSRMKDLYRTQLATYADACEKASGEKVKERFLYLFNAGIAVSV